MRSRWKALYTSRGQDSTQRISESQVFDLYAGEEMFQLFDVLFGRGSCLNLFSSGYTAMTRHNREQTTVRG